MLRSGGGYDHYYKAHIGVVPVVLFWTRAPYKYIWNLHRSVLITSLSLWTTQPQNMWPGKSWVCSQGWRTSIGTYVFEAPIFALVCCCSVKTNVDLVYWSTHHPIPLVSSNIIPTPRWAPKMNRFNTPLGFRGRDYEGLPGQPSGESNIQQSRWVTLYPFPKSTIIELQTSYWTASLYIYIYILHYITILNFIVTGNINVSTRTMDHHIFTIVQLLYRCRWISSKPRCEDAVLSVEVWRFQSKYISWNSKAWDWWDWWASRGTKLMVKSCQIPGISG